MKGTSFLNEVVDVINDSLDMNFEEIKNDGSASDFGSVKAMYKHSDAEKEQYIVLIKDDTYSIITYNTDCDGDVERYIYLTEEVSKFEEKDILNIAKRFSSIFEETEITEDDRMLNSDYDEYDDYEW